MEETRVVTESEWKILQQLWQHEPLTIMQLTHALEQETGWSKHTIISFESYGREGLCLLSG